MKNQKSLKCANCHEQVHAICSSEKSLKCGQCVVYPTDPLPIEVTDDDMIESLKRKVLLPAENILPLTISSSHDQEPSSRMLEPVQVQVDSVEDSSEKEKEHIRGNECEGIF